MMYNKTISKTAPSDVTYNCIVFEKEVISHLNEFDFETFKFYFEVLQSSIWKHTTCATMAFFLQLFYRNFDD